MKLTGPEHYEAGNRLAALLEKPESGECGSPKEASIIAHAQMHFTAALAAAHGLGCPANGQPARDRQEWFRVAGTPGPEKPAEPQPTP